MPKKTRRFKIDSRLLAAFLLGLLGAFIAVFSLGPFFQPSSQPYSYFGMPIVPGMMGGASVPNLSAYLQKPCVNLTDEEAEALGERAMNVMVCGVDSVEPTCTAHSSMNSRMKEMMGQRGEEQMHAVLGRRAVGCY